MLSYTPSKPKSRTIWDEIGLPQRGNRLKQAIDKGLPYSTYQRVARYGNMTNTQLAKALGIKTSTLKLRATKKQLNVDESDKVYRIAQLFIAATVLFEGDKEKALEWLNTPASGLNSHKPVMMANTHAGTTEALDLIGRLEHGVFG